MVKAVTAEGYLRFVPLGNWWPQVLLSGTVRVRGSRGEVRGVIGSKPPHFLREKERKELMAVEDMFIDIAAGSRDGAAAFGVAPGDPVVPDVAPSAVAGGEVIMGKALDDRVGVMAVIEAAKELARADHPNTVYAVGTVQEEVGARGARTAARMLHPDVCLVLEGTPADDWPGHAGELTQGALGRGPQIRMFDPSMIGNRPLINLALAEAEAARAKEAGSTDAAGVSTPAPNCTGVWRFIAAASSTAG